MSQTSGQKPRSTDQDSPTWVDEPTPAEEREDLVGWNTTTTKPAKPENTEETEETAGPVTPATSKKPARAAKPANAAEPASTAKVDNSAKSSNPGDLSEPAESAKLTETAKLATPTSPAELDKPADSTESAKPTETAKLATPNSPTELDELDEPADSTESAKPTETVKLATLATPTDLTEPADSTDLVEPARPARADRSGWPALPARPVRRGSPLLAIRTPIKPRAKWILYALSFAVPFAGWWILSEIEVFPAQYFPTPEKSFAALIRLAEEGTLFSDLWDTTRRILVGYGISIAISAPLGFAIGTWAAGRALFEPFISLIRYIPATALIPLLLLWLGIDEAPKIALLTLATVFFNTMMIADVVKSVPMPMINVSYTLGARRGEVLRKVILPHSLPGTVDAIRVNLAAAWNFVVVSELISSTTGLGRRIAQAQRFTRTDEIFAMLIVIGIVGVIFDVTLRLLRNRVGRWMV